VRVAGRRGHVAELTPEGSAPVRAAHLLDYWRVIVHRRWVIGLATAVVATCVAISTFMMRPVYRATVQLQIEKNTPRFLPFQDIVAGMNEAGPDFYQTQYRIIQSRTVARRVIETLDLARHPDFAGTSGAGAADENQGDAGVADNNAPVVDRFLGRLSVNPIRNSRLVSVSFDSSDPALSARVANAAADAYVAFTLDTSSTTSESASHSMVQQIHDLQEDISRSQRALNEYARERQLIFAGDQQISAEQDLTNLRTEYGRAQAERIAKEAAYRSFKEADPAAIPAVVSNSLIQELRSAYATLEKEDAEKSEKFKPDWPALAELRARREAARRQLDEQIVQIAARVVDSAAVEYREAARREEGVKAALDRLTGQVQELNLSAITYYSMKADLQSKKKNLEELLQRQGQTGISARMSDKATSNIRVVDRAEIPKWPYKPRRKLNIAIGILAGMLFGTALAFFLEYMDNTIKTPADVETYLRLATLAVIPSMSEGISPRAVAKRSNADPAELPLDLISHLASKSNMAEAYKELRTSILLSSPDAAPGSIMLTSSHPGEGKTTTAINLAITMTQMGHRVLLVDADLRKPRIHRALGVPNAKGASSFLSGNCEINDAVVETNIPGLWILPSGPIPPNPSELLESSRLQELLKMTGGPGGFAHIIFDSPPLLSFADSSILSTRVDAIVLIVWGGRTNRDLAIRGREKLTQGRARLIGAVINNVRREDGDYYYYRSKYYDYYAHAEDKPPQASRARHKRPSIRVRLRMTG